MARGGKREGAGRTKGVPNKINADIKAMLLEALSEAGGKDYFLQQARDNPSSFNTLIAKIIPAEIKQELTGKDGGALETKVTIAPPNLTVDEWLKKYRDVDTAKG